MTAHALATALRDALLPGHTDTGRLLRLRLPAGVPPLLPDRLDGAEAVGPFPTAGSADPAGAGFRLTLQVLSPDAALQAGDYLGQPACLELALGPGAGHRPFHGHITRFQLLRADGGFGYYRIVLEPWLAFLGWRRDSFVFRDQNVVQIAESLFADYTQATLAPAWRWALREPEAYRARSTCTQYGETDLAFLSRLCAQEGLFWWFEHEGGDREDSLGAHTLVIADHLDAFASAPPEALSLQRGAALRTREGLLALRHTHRWGPTARELVSWDARSMQPLQASAPAPAAVADMPLVMRDAPGLYAWPDADTGERFARVWIEGETAAASPWHGTATVRSLAPGQRQRATTAHGEPVELAILRVNHQAHNNLGSSLGAALAADGLTGVVAPDQHPCTQHFVAQHATLPFRAAPRLADGSAAFPPPCARPQSAVVVGTAGEPVLTDRDGRIRVQFAWQRGSASASRLAHPSGEDNAPAREAAWSWVRVAQPWAGANWGAVFTPRVGQEVWVSFVEGDPDRPVVTGALYNGRGAPDAQHNTVAGGAAGVSGNAPAWFAGATAADTSSARPPADAAPGHGHGACLWGLKSQALSSSASGAGGFSQLVFDLTPEEPRVQLATTQHASGLSLGALRHQFGNQRLGLRGHGAELASAHSGALRAGAGLLLSSAPHGAATAQMDAALAQAALAQAQALSRALADTARAQGATLPAEPPAADLPAMQALARTGEDLAATDTRSPTGQEGGCGTVPAWASPMMVVEGQAGIAALTPTDALFATGATLSTAAADTQLCAQGHIAWAAGQGVLLFTHGQAGQSTRPVSTTGLRLHAAHGAFSMQAQSDTLTLAAEQRMTVSSTTASLHLQGKNTLTLAAAGAGLELAGGNITLTAPGTVALKAAMRNLAGPASAGGEGVAMQAGQLRPCAAQMQVAARDGGATVPLGD